MSIGRQIRLVLWKNYTIRRRRWSRVLFELIWPLFLFLILVWVRTRNLTFYYDACHNDPKYLGSTGFFPALQTYLCRWNNTCHNYSRTTDQFNGNASFWKDLSELSESLQIILNDPQSLDTLTNLSSQLNSFKNQTNIWDGTIRANKTANDFNQSIPAEIIAILFANPVNLSNLHQSWLVNQTERSTSNFEIRLEIYLASMQNNFSYEYQSEMVVARSFCVEEQFNRTFQIDRTKWRETKEFLCGNLSASDLKAFLIEVQQQLDEKFLEDTRPMFADLITNGLEIGQMLLELGDRLNMLNVTFPFNASNYSLSLTSFCDGRNDLSESFARNASGITSRESSSESRATSLLDYNWNAFANSLLSYKPSQMCRKSYVTGSGSITQVIMVNQTCRCVLFDQLFNSNQFLRQFIRFLQPILYGKIYYYPSNVHYDRIIQHINQTFESLDELLRLFRLMDTNIRSTYQTLQIICFRNFRSRLNCADLRRYRTAISLFTILTEFLACTERNRFVAMNSEAEMVAEGLNKSVTNNFLAAIAFLDPILINGSLPKHIRFKIRMSSDYVDSTFRTEDRYFSYAPRTTAPLSTKYHSFGFIYLQNAIERAIISVQTGRNISYGIQTQQMPYPCWINDKFVNSIRQMLPLFMVLSWIFTVSMNVKDIVYEKEKRLKEIMRIMGLKDSVHWLTWFILCTSVMIVIAVLLAVLLKFGKITQFSSFGVLLLFLVAYTFATVNQCFLLSVFFNRANLAACGAGILFFLLYLPYTVLVSYDAQTRTWHKVLASLSSTVAFGLGCDYIARFEGMAKGIQWSNIDKGARPNDNFSFLNCIIMMFIDSIIYMVLTIYIENVFPGEYGIPQVWYYPFTKTYWFGFDAKKIRDRSEEMRDKTQSTEQDQGEIGVEIANLSKYFGNKIALQNLSIKFYRNMITAFLGRNGAGKSTTWAILTGLIPPSSGTVYVDGYDILTDIKIIRKRLGFAPQYNILFDLLTVKEHLQFFSELKDAPRELIESETEKMLNDLSLETKSNNYSTELSGGMKRKLSIAIAFIGDSSTVILDEPTAGVDPFARRAIWDLILKYKANRTIVLSTHHLDEADLLSDRLAIISSGELQCVGTTMYLKRKYGEGYHLIVELNSDETKNANRFDKVTEFLRRFMFDIKIKEQHGDQITYVIIDDIEHTKIFPSMLSELEVNKSEYQIKVYGLSNSSLEQVFLRVADEVKRPEDYERMSNWKSCKNRLKKCLKKRPTTSNAVQDESIVTNPILTDIWSSYTLERHTGMHRIGMQIVGLIVKRFHRTKRNMKGLIAELLLPILFVLLMVLATKLAPDQTAPPPLILHPWYWGEPNYIFQSLSKNTNSSFSQSIQQTFNQSPSLGTRCMKSTMLNRKLYPCTQSGIGRVDMQTSSEVYDALNSVDYNQTRISPSCDCWEKMQTCPVGAGGPSASFNYIETRDILYDLAGFNITDWVVKSEYKSEYLMKRFGGLEFLSTSVTDDLQIFNETMIEQMIRIINQSSLNINPKKVASLFRITPPQISVWYNNKGWPSSVAFLNIFNNALLRAILSENNSSMDMNEYGITAINHPLPQSDIQNDSDLLSRIALDSFRAICIIFALAFIPASFLVFLIDERVTTSKHLQFVSGIKGLTYWCGNFLWDLGNYCVSITCCILIFLIFNIEVYVSQSNLLCLILLLFLYGFAIIPLMYPINYFFQSPSTGFVLVSCVNIFVGLISTISTITLDTFDDQQDLRQINGILTKVFLIFPHYCLGRGLFDMSRVYTTNLISQKYIIGYVPISPFQMNMVGRNLLALFIEGIVFFLFAILVQYRFFIPDRGCIRAPKNLQSTIEDNDVAAERQRIHSDHSNSANDILRMVDLVKIYGSILGKTFPAVKQTCVGVKQGECFGLLGINGSGKSTTFKMLTGEISMTAGNAYVNNSSVIKQLDQVRQNIGYCPQFDALDGLLTAREHLYFYGRLCGIREKNLAFIADCLLKRLGLTLWADRPVRQYSGGNKRKLSTAISLIGNPSIIFMDEPTTGMDVRAKRFLWDCILTLTRQEKKSVVITSHSMEECETLCNRLVIMVSGEFKCLGTVQHLKEKFGDGYTIFIRTAIDTNRTRVIEYIQRSIPQALVKEEHNKMIHFRVPTVIPLYKIFAILENVRQELTDLIEDYTVTQVTLDDVFVSFAKMQAEEEQIDEHPKSNNSIVPM